MSKAAATRGKAPGLAIELQEPCPRWREVLPRRRVLCMKAAKAALGAVRPRFKLPAEIGIVLADDALVRRLNRRWRRIDKPTNVLSFPAEDLASPPGAPLLLGDVVLAFETVSREAGAQRKKLADHLCHLVMHGVLHLVGYDHEIAADAERMETLETTLLAELGIADPYDQPDLPSHRRPLAMSEAQNG